MPGTFSTDSRPRRPGGYVNFSAAAPITIPPASGSIVAIPITHDWGPLRLTRLVQSWGEFLATYGDTVTAGALAVKQAFIGEGFDGRAGAGAVLVYRNGLAAAAKATKTLQSAEASPVNTLVLSAEYEGTRGNSLRVAVVDTPGVAANNDLIISDSTGRELERYTHANADMAGLAAAINLRSNYATATVTTGSEAKVLWAAGFTTNATATAFTGGTDGTPLTATEWTAAKGALEFERFGIFCPAGLTDSSIQTDLAQWTRDRNKQGQRFITVMGNGSAGTPDTVAVANSRSLSWNDPSIVNVGGFVVTWDDDGTPRTLYPGDVAPRVAGVLAARGQNRSATFARLAGLTLATPPSSAEVDTAFDSGTLVLSRGFGSNPVRIEKALTTWTTKTEVARPYGIYRNPKFMLTMCSVENEVTEYAESPGIIGELGVNDKTRATVAAEMASRLRTREQAGILQSGWSVQIEQNPPPSNDDEFVALRYAFKFLRTVEQVYGTVLVG